MQAVDEAQTSSERRGFAVASPFWDLCPVAVSLVASAAVVIRSATTLNGHRAYLLFDDAAISLTYARSLATGHGLVWMAGQHPVEGYSNFLWTVWMGAIQWLGPSDDMIGLWVMLSGAILLAANVYVIARIARRLAPGQPVIPLLAGLAAALYYSLNSWTLIGMETGLVALLSSSAVLCALRACDPDGPPGLTTRFLVGSGVLLALDLLTRDDAFIVALAVIFFIFMRSEHGQRAVAIVGAPVLVAGIGHLAFRIAYYGYPVPNTYYLKVAGIPLSWRLDRGLVVIAQNATMQLVVPLVLAAAYFVMRYRRRMAPARGSGLLIAVIGAQALYVMYVGGDSYDWSYADRYIAPFVPFLFIVAALGALELADSIKTWPSAMAVCGGIVIIAGVIVALSLLPIRLIQEIAPGQSEQMMWWSALIISAGALLICISGIRMLHRRSSTMIAFLLVGASIVATNGVPIVVWAQQNTFSNSWERLVAADGVALAETTTKTTTVAITGAGNITYFDHRPSIDLFGYSDHFIASTQPHNLPFLAFQPGHDKWDYVYSIGRLRPDVVMELYFPTAKDLANMTTWGYRSYTVPIPGIGIIYYLPGHFDPIRFGAAFLAATGGSAPPSGAHLRIG